MIVWLKNEEIDRLKWDGTLAEIPGAKPYAWSWYLDIISPGWEALVDDDYCSLFPLPRSKKYGLSYIATPVFLQQLGLFAPDGDGKKIALEFIAFMPELYRFIDLNIGQEVKLPGYTLTPRYNFELKLSDPYEKVWVNYMSDCRRNINIAHRYPQEIVEDVKPHEVISLQEHNWHKGGSDQGDKLQEASQPDGSLSADREGKDLRCSVTKRQVVVGNLRH